MERPRVMVATKAVTMALLVVLVAGGGSGGVEATHRVARQSVFPSFQSRCQRGEDCMPIRNCPALLAILANPTPQGIRRLRQSHCGFDNRIPLTCCARSRAPTPPPVTTPTPTTPTPTTPSPPTTPSTSPSTSQGGEDLLPSQCGISASGQTRIFFGEDAPLGAFPWIALIGYASSGPTPIVWGCGGALINTRYVLTAGHCTDPQFTFNRRLSAIRLGEHNLTSPVDCETRGGNRICAPPHQTFSPAEIIRHPTFNTRGTVGDDIALVRLDREADFNLFVAPVCLPPPTTDLPSFLGGRQGFVAGWGATERGPDTQILQQVRLPFVTREECNPHYNNALLAEQVCFGGDEQRDTCFGDSGGPVVAPMPGTGNFMMLALVSFGQPSCGVPGVPAVYTSVPAYRAWILENLKP